MRDIHLTAAVCCVATSIEWHGEDSLYIQMMHELQHKMGDTLKWELNNWISLNGVAGSPKQLFKKHLLKLVYFEASLKRTDTF